MRTFCIPFVLILSMITGGTVLPLPAKSTEVRILLERGRRLLAAGDHGGAREMFLRALPRIGERDMRARVHFDLARTAFHMENTDEAENHLRALFEIDRNHVTEGNGLAEGFVCLFEKVKAEYWFAIRPDDEYREEAEKQVIANLARKPKRKKVSAFLIVAAAVVVVAAVVAVSALVKDSQSEQLDSIGQLWVVNNTTHDIWLDVAGRRLLIGPSQMEILFLSAGHYLAAIYTGNQDRVQYVGVTITPNETVTITIRPDFWDR